jgi:O-antigen/teichoic acid export membrane protein
MIIKDALWQIVGRLLSALGGFVVISLMTPYLGPLRFGDYSTILKYFAIRSALADFGLYVLAIKKLWQLKQSLQDNIDQTLSDYYSRFVTSRLVMICGVYILALGIAYLIPSYTSNIYLLYGLPMWMLFSASFMFAGILQLPVQLYGKMHHTTIALSLARIVQITSLAMIVWYLYPDYSGLVTMPPSVFVMVLWSVVLSGIAQSLYIWRASSRYLRLRWIWDPAFTRQQFFSNWQYGFAYYLSSFHTLIVVIMLSIFFPTIDGWMYVGIWAFALQLMELALIIPSSMANSLLHKVSDSHLDQKKHAFGALMTMMIWIATVCFVNFVMFGSTIIQVIGGQTYLSHVVNGSRQMWSDFVLPFLGIVLILSFIKQIFNYIFVSCDLHNKIFVVNVVGVCVGLMCGIPLVYMYGLWWWIATQMILECGFVLWAYVLAYRYDCLPRLGWYEHRSRVIVVASVAFVLYVVRYLFWYSHAMAYILVVVSNLIIFLWSYPSIRRILHLLRSITSA